MPKYAEGNSANPATTNTAISSSQHNDAETQLAGMLGPRVYNVMSTAENNSGWQLFTAGGVPYKWQTSTNSVGIDIPFDLYAGQKITSVSMTVSGATGSLGGYMRFCYAAEGSNVVATDITGGTSNPWDTGGASYGSSQTYTLSTAPIPLVITAGMGLFFEFGSPSNASTYNPVVWAIKVTVQFGN